MAKATKTTVVLNDFGGGALQRRSATSASGKTTDRYTVTLDAAPLALNFDTKSLGAGVAQAITEHLQKSVGAIGASASPATLKARESAERAFKAGKPWAMKRYAGGRTGPMEPNQSDRLFNDSGRFVNGITANPTKDNNWVVNVPANRLNASLLGGENALIRMVDRLRQFVPEFGSASGLMSVLSVRRAIKDATSAIVQKRRSSAFGKFAGDVFKTVLKELAR